MGLRLNRLKLKSGIDLSKIPLNKNVEIILRNGCTVRAQIYLITDKYLEYFDQMNQLQWFDKRHTFQIKLIDIAEITWGKT